MMKIKRVTNLGKGIMFEVMMEGAWYNLLINTEQTWSHLESYDGAGNATWVGISDEKLLRKLKRAWSKAQFLG